MTKAIQSRRLFLFIGINEFADRDFPSLEFPHKDVDDFQQFVQRNNADDQDLIVVLKGSNATLAKIIEALDTLEKNNMSDQDMVLIYLSTHGTLDFGSRRQLERYAVVHDTSFRQTRGKGLSIEYLENRLGRLRSQRKALILALCHSGSGKSALPEAIHSELRSMKGPIAPKALYEASSAMMVLSASSWGEAAREDKVLKNDVYTHFLLEGLQKNDANEDGAISIFEAHEYARAKTYDFTLGAQTPAALVNLKGMDPMILHGKVKQSGKPLVYADSNVWRSLGLRINGQAKGTLWQPQKAEVGNVRVELLDPEHPDQPILDSYVYLGAHHSYSVSALLSHRSSWSLQGIIGQIPVDLAREGSALRDAKTFGLGVSFQDIPSTPLAAHLEYSRMNQKTQRTIDYESSELNYTADLISIGIGAKQLLSRQFSLSAKLSIDQLNLQRQIRNDSYTQRMQNLRLTYPAIAFEIRYLNLVGSWFLGFGCVVYPIRSKIVSWDEKGYALLPATGRVSFGTTFF